MRTQWIKELKEMKAEAKAELAKLDMNSKLDMIRASELMFAINEINGSIISQQEALINELEREAA